LSYLEISKPNLRNNLKQLFAMKNSILIFALALASVVNAQSSPFSLQFTGLNESCVLDPVVDRVEITYQTVGDNTLSVFPVVTATLGSTYSLTPPIGCDYIMVRSVDVLNNTLSVKVVFPQNLIAGGTNVISIY